MQAVPENQQKRAQQILSGSVYLMFLYVAEHLIIYLITFFSIFIIDTDFELVAGMNPFSAVA